MSEITDIKDLIQTQGDAHAAYQEAMEARMVAMEANKGTAELEKKIDDTLEAYDKSKDALNKMIADNKRGDFGSETEIHDKKIIEAFDAFARSGSTAAYDEMSVNSDPDGGYTVPTITLKRIVDVASNANPMRMLSNIETISVGDSIEILATPGGVAVGAVGEVESRTETTTPTIADQKIYIKEMYALPIATQKLLNDSAWNIEDFLVKKGGRAFNNEENDWYTNGDGVLEARGMLTYTTVANATWEADVETYWGQIGYIASGSISSLGTADKLLDMISALKSEYLSNASWQMSRTNLNIIRKFKKTTTTASDNEYVLWTPSLIGGQPDKLIGYNVHKNDNMPAISSAALPIVFGDMQQAYTILDKSGITMLRDNLTTKGKVKFYMVKRTGGGVENFEALKFLKTSTS